VRVRELSAADLYATLGVAPDASAEEIARAYRALAKRLHPDAPGAPADAEAEARFREVAGAYETLGDPDRRRSYDLARFGVAVERVRVAAPPAKQRVPEPPPPLLVTWTPRRAIAAIVCGVVVTLLGAAICAGVLAAMRASAAARADDVPVLAQRVLVDGEPSVRFTTRDGEIVVAPEPEQVNPGLRTGDIEIRYDPDDPTDVQVDESTLARDLTWLLVGVKLVVAGPVFAVIGRRRLRATAAR
jgi:hypothetical protein